jgi:hypothetical protein
MLHVMKSSAESSMIGGKSPPIADIALQQSTSASRTDFAFVCAAAKNQVRLTLFCKSLVESVTCRAQSRAARRRAPVDRGAQVQVCPARTA